MNFQEYLAIRSLENPLDYVKKILVMPIYENPYFVSEELNNGVVFVKENYDSEGEYFDIYGNRGCEIYNDSVTNNRVAIDLQYTKTENENSTDVSVKYLGNCSVEKLKDYLLICPTLFRFLPKRIIAEHGDELLNASIYSLKRHFTLFRNHALDRGNGRYVNNIYGASLADSFKSGVKNIYLKYMTSNGISANDAKKIIGAKIKSLDKYKNYIPEVEDFLAYSSEVKEMGKIRWEIISSFLFKKFFYIIFIFIILFNIDFTKILIIRFYRKEKYFKNI